MEEKDWKTLGTVLGVIGIVLSLGGIYLCMQTATITIFGATITVYPYFQTGMMLVVFGFALSCGGAVMSFFGMKKKVRVCVICGKSYVKGRGMTCSDDCYKEWLRKQ